MRWRLCSFIHPELAVAVKLCLAAHYVGFSVPNAFVVGCELQKQWFCFCRQLHRPLFAALAMRRRTGLQ